MANVSIENLSKSFVRYEREKEEKVDVIKDLSINIKEGQFITFFGPNGCGKTTLLGIIAGLINPSSGIVKINERLPTESKIGYVFQHYQETLFPWRRNIDNIAFPLELEKIPKNERYSRTRALLKELEITTIEEGGYPYQLSGGQQRLLTIARALITTPEILLMDEPFEGLDYFTRLSMQEKLLNIWQKKGVTTLFVSHDIDEAIFLANRLILLTKRPAGIFEILELDLPFPRNFMTFQSQSFFELKKIALDAIQKVLEK